MKCKNPSRKMRVTDLQSTIELHVVYGSQCSSVAGIGVCDLNEYLTQLGLIHKNNRPCIVICTHCHYNHAGGAHHFTTDPVYIHADDAAALRSGRQTATLNYVKPVHFQEKPYPGFSAFRYRVPPTPCQELTKGQVPYCVSLLL